MTPEERIIKLEADVAEIRAALLDAGILAQPPVTRDYIEQILQNHKEAGVEFRRE